MKKTKMIMIYQCKCINFNNITVNKNGNLMLDIVINIKL